MKSKSANSRYERESLGGQVTAPFVDGLPLKAACHLVKSSVGSGVRLMRFCFVGRQPKAQATDIISSVILVHAFQLVDQHFDVVGIIDWRVNQVNTTRCKCVFQDGPKF